ncbi:MAG: acetylxylan esterase [Planctomycetaceae bacterium]|nr:acetylxylan esterase [Planctomycetales bacterium]MCB9872737.1 acetylxylan esterase [Planctomycetaceae bacterium]MCB9926223.1 acetylxylan esterase [Planctomycetaceae bacterium]
MKDHMLCNNTQLRSFVVMCICLATSAAVGEDELNVLTDHPGKHLELLLKRQFNEQLDRRLAAYSELKSRADCERWQRERRGFFLRQIGGLPERTPLNARVVGALKGDGYRVEKILFESRPRHHVTANLYLPEAAGPYPGVIVPCGHSHDGKAASGYQRMSILLARHGMAALCYDPIGQGERYQSLDFEHDHETFESVSYRLETPHPRVQFLCTTEHTLMGVSCILLGTNTAQFRIWDGMRAIDYLQSRDDILADKIGCTGNSGGGTLTAYLMALDDRIVAAAPACYLTTFQRLIDTKGAQDAEQNIFGQIAVGMDEPDYVMMRAPKPTLICASTRDATFDIGGTWDLFRQSKRFYARLGFPERVELNEADVPHGMYLQHREAIASWMHRWLLGQDKVIREVDPQTLPDPISDEELRAISEGDWTAKDLYCTPDGQVLLMQGEKSVFQINADIEQALRAEREATWTTLNDEQRRELIRKTILGEELQTPTNSPDEAAIAGDQHNKVKTIGTIQRDGYRIEKVVLVGNEHELALPGLLFVPETISKSPVLYLDGNDMKAEAQPGGRCEQLAKAGHVVLSAELSGIGETETGHDKQDYGRGRFGRDVQEIYLAYLMGRSFVGMRSADVFRWSDYLSRYGSHDRPRAIQLIATDEATIPALHAAALEPMRFESVHLQRMVRSWADVVAAPESMNQLVNSVHGALRHYDLPELVELVGRERVTIEQPVDASGRQIN